MIRPLYIFDLDGTLAKIEHRRHYVERPSSQCFDCHGKNRKNCPQCADLDAGWTANWPAFFRACVYDTPNKPVIQLMNDLIHGDNSVWIWSGRSDEVRADTINWLYTWTSYRAGDGLSFMMRREGDHQPDDKLKLEWYRQMTGLDKNRLVMIFDDRDRMVQMWRDNGIACLQVAPGNF